MILNQGLIMCQSDMRPLKGIVYKLILLTISMMIVISCDKDNSNLVVPGRGFSRYQMGVLKSELPDLESDPLRHNLIFDDKLRLVAISDVDNKLYVVKNYNLRVGDYLDISLHKDKYSAADQMSYNQKFKQDDKEYLDIIFQDGIIFKIDKNNKIKSFSLFPPLQ